MPIETPRTYVNLAFEPEPPPRRSHGRRVAAGVGALAALALAGGFLLAPRMDRPQPATTAPAPSTGTPAPSGGLDIIVDDRPDPAAAALPEGILPPVDSTPAESRPREEPKPASQVSAPKASQPRAAQPRADPAPASPPPARATSLPPAPVVAEAPVTRPYVPTPPPTARRTGRARPSFNCRYASTVSEQMICADPYLAAADRRMVRAYHQAIRRGVPEPELRRQQDIWLGVRESAVRAGPEGVARAYETRTAELQAMRR